MGSRRTQQRAGGVEDARRGRHTDMTSWNRLRVLLRGVTPVPTTGFTSVLVIWIATNTTKFLVQLHAYGYIGCDDAKFFWFL